MMLAAVLAALPYAPLLVVYGWLVWSLWTVEVRDGR